MSPPKTCAVCGDRALGYNFNAVTCESCKAFFRRNALAKKQFTCPFNQNCEITVVTRRFCQKCRLKKCVDIGMNSENIMSEEDKLIKRRKIECNRAKRRLTDQKESEESEETSDRKVAADSSGYDTGVASYDSHSCGSFESGGNAVGQSETPTSSKSMLSSPIRDVNAELMTSEEMVEYIVGDPDRASQAISKLMRTPTEAVATLEKIINSQKDALRLISHLIAYPGDGLKIISKIMNSPFNALTVFTKFMSSPTDALEIISKIVSSPQDVLQFIKNLMNSPEDALDIMNKFMNTPAEALKIINKLFNGSNAPPRSEKNLPLTPQTPMDGEPELQTRMDTVKGENALIYSMLNNSPTETQLLGANSVHPVALHIAQKFTPSPQSMSISSPVSISSSEQQYQTPTTIQHAEMASSPTTVITSPMNISTDETYTEDQYDVKTLMQNSIFESHIAGDSINSLESVLSEVIRIEFQAFNNLPSEPRVKQEFYSTVPAVASSHHQTNHFVACEAVSEQQPICVASSSVAGARDLNDTEQMKLRELKVASEALYYPLDEDMNMLMMGDERIKPEETHQNPKLLQVINLTAIAIKRLIKMAKKITAFRDMCQEDQVALLKGGCTEMMIMRSVMTYDGNRNTWKIPHTKEDMSNLRTDVLKLAKGNVYEEHLKFVRTFDEKWRLDENIILIMCAIVLFTPARPHIIHSDVIKLEQNSYYYLLRRYLESVYPGCEAKSAFIKLIQKISDVERLNRSIIGVYLNVNPSLVEPLLREIFDLKNH